MSILPQTRKVLGARKWAQIIVTTCNLTQGYSEYVRGIFCHPIAPLGPDICMSYHRSANHVHPASRVATASSNFFQTPSSDQRHRSASTATRGEAPATYSNMPSSCKELRKS